MPGLVSKEVHFSEGFTLTASCMTPSADVWVWTSIITWFHLPCSMQPDVNYYCLLAYIAPSGLNVLFDVCTARAAGSVHHRLRREVSALSTSLQIRV